MNYKNFIILIVIIIIGSSLSISILNPILHKPIFITKDNIDISKEDSTKNLKSKDITVTERIWWNQWSSNFHNKFYKDLNKKTNNAIPDKYHYMVTFEVTDNGKINNLKIEGNPANYRKILERYTKEILQNYEQTSLLKFPTNTNLKAKPVKIEFSDKGNFKGNATPKDFANDYEDVQVKK